MLIAKINYSYYLFTQDVGSLAECLLSAVEVTEKFVGNQKKYYVKKQEEGREIEVGYVKDSLVVFPEEEAVIEKDTKVLLEEEKKNSSRNYKWYCEQVEKAKKLEAENELLRKMCPTSHLKKEAEEDE